MFQITIINDICGQAYDELIYYLIQRSDSFLFHLPNMGRLFINERNAEFFPEYSIGYVEETDQDKHTEYMAKMYPLLAIIQDDIIEQHKDTGYLDQISSIEMEVFKVLISEKTRSFFKKANSIFSWKYPELPEDLCFLSNDVCAFQCIAHEGMCYFNSNDSWILRFIKKYDIDFFISY